MTSAFRGYAGFLVHTRARSPAQAAVRELSKSISEQQEKRKKFSRRRRHNPVRPTTSLLPRTSSATHLRGLPVRACLRMPTWTTSTIATRTSTRRLAGRSTSAFQDIFTSFCACVARCTLIACGSNRYTVEIRQNLERGTAL